MKGSSFDLQWVNFVMKVIPENAYICCYGDILNMVVYIPFFRAILMKKVQKELICSIKSNRPYLTGSQAGKNLVKILICLKKILLLAFNLKKKKKDKKKYLARDTTWQIKSLFLLSLGSSGPILILGKLSPHKVTLTDICRLQITWLPYEGSQ